MKSQEKGEYMATKMSPKCTMKDPEYNFLATRARLFQETEEGGRHAGRSEGEAK